MACRNLQTLPKNEEERRARRKRVNGLSSEEVRDAIKARIQEETVTKESLDDTVPLCSTLLTTWTLSSRLKVTLT